MDFHSSLMSVSLLELEQCLDGTKKLNESVGGSVKAKEGANEASNRSTHWLMTLKKLMNHSSLMTMSASLIFGYCYRLANHDPKKGGALAHTRVGIQCHV